MKSFSVQGTFHLHPEKLNEAGGEGSGAGGASITSATSVTAETSLLMLPRSGSDEGLLCLALF